MDDNNIASNLVTGNFSLTAQMANGKSMTIGGYVYDGESLESVNARVSLMHDSLDFQRKRSEIPELEAKREQMITQVKNIRDVLVSLQQKEANGGKITQAERAQIANLIVSADKAEADIVKGAAIIAAAKKEVGIE